MPSQIARIVGEYEEALRLSKGRFEMMFKERFDNSCRFYDDFFRNLLTSFADTFENEAEVRRIIKVIEQLFGTKELKFAAIDGTCYKKQLENYMVFFGAAYAVRGQIRLMDQPPSVRYEKYSVEWDTSMVAYVPVPFAELGDLAEKQFTVSDEDKINLSFVHTQLMLLAEVYLAYDLVRSPGFAPNVLLWDQSMSSVMARTDIGVEDVGLVGYQFGKNRLTRQDIIVSYSHPYNKALRVPSSKKFRVYNWVLERLNSSPTPLKIAALAQEASLDQKELEGRCRHYLFDKWDGAKSIVDFDDPEGTLALNADYEDSWRFVLNLFDNVCTKLFKEKDPAALVYRTRDESGELRDRWMAPPDLDFLIAVGIRALVEECWKKNILLLGITKDSASKYLSKNYLGVMRNVGRYKFEDTLLPWTDRTFLEVLPYHDERLKAPWSTIEFDSCFMTLHLEEDEKGDVRVKGVRGDVVTTERLFAKSLAQFYLARNGARLSQGHVIFVDRLLNPEHDSKVVGIDVKGEKIGTVSPIVFADTVAKNQLQEISMFLLNILTRNLYPEVIGYPDPLHKADWGAKSLLKKIEPMIESSELFLRAHPLTQTFRDLRSQRKRT